MTCTWFPAFWAKNPKWPSKEAILGRQKSLWNRGEVGLKMIARTPRSRFIQYLPCFVHDFQRFGPKTQHGPQRSKFWAVKKSLSNRGEFGLKMIASTRRSRFDNICYDLYMIFSVLGQKPKMALQGANFGPSKNSLKSRRVGAQNDRGNA